MNGKRLYYKIIVLHEFKEIYDKKIHYHRKLSNSIINRCASFQNYITILENIIWILSMFIVYI